MNPLESAKRYVVYAPLGFVAMVRDIGPGMVSMLAERGRHELSKPNFVTESVERLGEYTQLAVAVARPEIEKRFGSARSQSRFPLENYDNLTAAEILAGSASLTAAQKSELATYEAAHRNRKSVLNGLEAR